MPFHLRRPHAPVDDVILRGTRPAADNDDQAVAVRTLLGSTPATGLVGYGSDRTVAFVLGSLDLEPALAPGTSADRVVVDRGIKAELAALELVPHVTERCADLVVGWDLRVPTVFLS
jgi:hypothetical protein